MITALRNARHFEQLREHGERVDLGPLTLIVAAEIDQQSTQVAFAIPKRVGTAVVRNRLRRRLRAILRELDQTGRLRPGRYLLLCRPNLVHFSHSQMVGLVDQGLERLRT